MESKVLAGSVEVDEWRVGRLALAIAAAVAVLGAGAVQANTLVISNHAAFGGGPIETDDVTAHTFVNSYVPDAAQQGTNNGRAVEVLGNFVYYTELTNGFGPSDGIHVSFFNNGAGSADVHAPYANPVPGTGIVDLAAAGGVLYALTGYPSGPEVIQGTDGNGTNVGPLITPHTLSGGTLSNSDGFTVLPNGNFLINLGDGTNSYSEFDPVTGNEIAGTNIQAHNEFGACSSSTGVDNDGQFLYFACGLNTVIQTDFLGNYIPGGTTNMQNGSSEDLSIVQAGPITPPVPTPEPATLSLLGAALLGLVGLKRRKA